MLAAAMTLLLTIAVGLTLAAGYRVASLNTAELVGEHAEQVIRTIEERTRGHLDPVRAQLDHLAALIRREDLDLRREEELGRVLAASLAAVPQVSAVLYVAPDLRVLRASRHPDAAPAVLDDWGEDPRFRRQMVRVEHAAEAFWGEMFVAEPTAATLINLFRPLRTDDGRYEGALIAGVSIFELSRFVASLEDEQTGRAFVLRGRRFVLAHPRLRRGFPGLTDAHPLPGLEAVGDPVLRTIWAADPRAAAEMGFGNRVAARAADVAGRRFVFLYDRLEGYGAEPWLVGTYFAAGEVAPQLRRLRYIWWAGLAALVLALALALLLARGLTRPVRGLAHAALRARDLDLDPAPAPPRGLFRELNEAAEAYEAMLAGLRAFATYVPRALVRRLVRRRGGALASEEREVTVLFTDVAGFTALAEGLPAAAVADFLTGHFTLIDRCVEAEDGTIDKYIGDSLMAFWGAPDEQPDHAERACRGALAIARALRADNAARARAGRPPVRVRAGLHTGRAVVGNIGAPSRVNYTVVGDVVNVAERLEELARAVAGETEEICLLVSGDTAGRLGAGFALSPVGAHALRGRQRPLDVFRLGGP
ncbi:MAG TPA: adenylate/guanylate cyclase domain-containing protein [Geminicoccaceae bacterium]|nr:adenylate/guanylate cyclase domain-containing protein [Geminicoccaceae bacterium]